MQIRSKLKKVKNQVGIYENKFCIGHLREEAPGGGVNFVPVASLYDQPLGLNFLIPTGEGVESFTFWRHNVLPWLDCIRQGADELGRGIGFPIGTCQCRNKEQEQEGLHFDEG